MKKILLNTTILIFSISFCYSQSDTGNVKKKCCNKWGFSVAYNSVEAQIDQQLTNTWLFPSTNYYNNFSDKKDESFSLSIIPRYYLNDNVLLRFEFGITYIKLYSHFNGYHDTLSPYWTNTIAEDMLKQKIYRFAPGIQWNFMKKKFLESYCGASLYYLRYSELHWNQDIKSNDFIGRGTNYLTTTPGGFATGTGVFSGFNIYLNKYISIGGELSYSLLYYKLGGVMNAIEVSTFPTSPTQTDYWSLENNKSEGIQFSKIMPSFNISIRF